MGGVFVQGNRQGRGTVGESTRLFLLTPSDKAFLGMGQDLIQKSLTLGLKRASTPPLSTLHFIPKGAVPFSRVPFRTPLTSPNKGLGRLEDLWWEGGSKSTCLRGRGW